MCTIMAMVSVLQSVASFAAADADYEAKSKQWQQNRTNALQAGRDEQKALSMRISQEQDAYVQKQQVANMEGAEKAATAEASGAAAGVAGLSLDNIIMGLGRQQAQKMEANKINYQNTAVQLTEQLKNTDTTIKGRINSMAVPQAPNPLGYILQGVGGALKSE